MFKRMAGDPFNKTLITLAIPIMIQYLINSSLNLVDTVMIGSMGEASIAAVGFCNIIYFLIMIALFGIASGTQVFMAQFWGAKDIKRIKHVQGIGLMTGLVLSSLFAAAALIFPEDLMHIFTTDPEPIALGADYLRIVGISYIATAVSLSYTAVLRSIENVVIPTAASFFALSLNTFLNWVLIFGHFGIEPMGVRGAAIATLISRLVEAVIIVSIVYKKKFAAASTPREMFSFDGAFVKKVVKTALPVFLNECLWSIGTSMYTVVYGHIGTNVAAAVNISGTVERMAWIAVFGLGSSASIMIGKKIGEGESDTAYAYGRRIMQYTTVVALIISGILFLINPHVLKLFNLLPQSVDTALMLMNIFAGFFTVRALSYVSCIGVLRSGGDSRFCLLVDLIGIWGFGVPLAAILGLVLKLPVWVVFVTVNAEDTLKFIPYIIRYRSKRWIKNLTKT
ncbi:MAG: MATE family efflux transporter [Clostridia bacterium]|nr:MATE family efflux transporter [Clostridia bacterium]